MTGRRFLPFQITQLRKHLRILPHPDLPLQLSYHSNFRPALIPGHYQSRNIQSARCQITSGNDQITGCHTADRIEIMYSGYKFDGHCHDISSYLLILHLIRTICHISASSRDSEFYRDSSCCPDSLFTASVTWRRCAVPGEPAM